MIHDIPQSAIDARRAAIYRKIRAKDEARRAALARGPRLRRARIHREAAERILRIKAFGPEVCRIVSFDGTVLSDRKVKPS